MSPDPIDYLRDDPDLQPLVTQYGELELDPADDLFERTVVSIVNQQLSTEAARTIRDRLFDAFEVTPEAMLAADRAALREVGLSTQKVQYVGNVAEWFAEENVTRDRFAPMSNAAVVDELTAITGLGAWTAKMILMFGLGREDVFPVEDLAIRKGMEATFGDETREEMRTRAANWAPYRSHASLYIWERYVDENSAVEGIVD